MDAAAIDDHHDLLPSFAERRHDLMNILAQLLGIKVGHDFIKDFGGAILDRPQDTEQHAVGDTAPGAITYPRLAFEGLLTFDLPLAQRAYGEACAWGFAPPTCAGQGETPEDRFVFIEHNDLATAGAVLKSSEFKRAIREIRWSGIKATGGPIVAYLFFLTHCAHFRGRGGPRFHGLRRSPARDNSIGHGGSHAPGGL